MGDDSTTIPHLSITIDDKDINSGALRVLQAIRPRWDPSDVDFKVRLLSLCTCVFLPIVLSCRAVFFLFRCLLIFME
jgi:hypothetical protein